MKKTPTVARPPTPTRMRPATPTRISPSPNTSPSRPQPNTQKQPIRGTPIKQSKPVAAAQPTTTLPLSQPPSLPPSFDSTIPPSPPANDKSALTTTVPTMDELLRSTAPLTSAAIRHSLLVHPLSYTARDEESGSGALSVRGELWSILLRVESCDGDAYIQLIRRGECAQYAKIRGDSFRTFNGLVSEAEIIRTLNSFVHECGHNATTTQLAHSHRAVNFNYVQGLNTVVAAFLYVLPELIAYNCFRRFITEWTPLYWIDNHIGTNAACVLVDAVVQQVDPALSTHLRSHHLTCKTYGFPLVSSFCTAAHPLEETLHLWDLLLNIGPFMNIFFVSAFVISMRQALIQSDRPANLLNYRNYPKMRGRYIVGIALSLMSMIDTHLLEDIKQHLVNDQVADRLIKENWNNNNNNNNNNNTQSLPLTAQITAREIPQEFSNIDSTDDLVIANDN